MALYKYRCKTCGVEPERLIAFSKRDSEFICEVCGGICERIFDLSRVSFKMAGTCSYKPKYKDGSRPKSHVPHMKHDVIDKR